MDHMGIRQWNVTNYLESYPATYYESMQSRGNLYVLRNDHFKTIGAVVLLQEDNRWSDRADASAFYIHNLVTDSEVKGAGSMILQEIERLAVREKKESLRLDCAIDNAFCNFNHLQI